MKIRRSLLYLFLLFSCSSFAKGFSSDSLKKVIYSKSTIDTVRAETIRRLAVHQKNAPYDSIMPLLDLALPIAEKHKNSKLFFQLVFEKVTTYVAANKQIEGLNYCEQLIRRAESENNTELKGLAYACRGDLFRSYGLYDKAEREYEKAVEYYKQTDNLKQYAKSVFVLGYIEFGNAKLEKALTHFKQAYFHGLKYNKSDLRNSVENSGWIGNAYRDLKQYDSAIYYRRLSQAYARQEYKETGSLYDYAETYRYLGAVYMKMEQYDSALVNFRNAYINFDKAKSDNRKKLVQYYIASVLNKQNNNAAAAAELDKLIASTKESDDYLVLVKIHKLGASVYERNNELRKAYNCALDLSRFTDSASQIGQQAELAERDNEIRFENEQKIFDLKQKEIEYKAKEELEKQALIRNVFIMGFLILAIFLIVVFKNYNQKKKVNKLLELQKSTIEEKQIEILSSIQYAQRIQNSLFPTEVYIDKTLKRLMKK